MSEFVWVITVLHSEMLISRGIPVRSGRLNAHSRLYGTKYGTCHKWNNVQSRVPKVQIPTGFRRIFTVFSNSIYILHRKLSARFWKFIKHNQKKYAMRPQHVASGFSLFVQRPTIWTLFNVPRFKKEKKKTTHIQGRRENRCSFFRTVIWKSSRRSLNCALAYTPKIAWFSNGSAMPKWERWVRASWQSSACDQRVEHPRSVDHRCAKQKEPTVRPSENKLTGEVV